MHLKKGPVAASVGIGKYIVIINGHNILLLFIYFLYMRRGIFMASNEFDLYKDIQGRTNGEIYIGVVGPVRTGKSTFIKRFIDLCVLPFIEDENDRNRLVDELPQAGQGKMIMTTEPKFIPLKAADIVLEDDTRAKIRMIDCVGFMVDGASGHMEGENTRMVKTPWFDEDVTFEDAATIGTEKVIKDHATIAIMVTTDGSFGDIPRENYLKAERETVEQLKASDKPFVILLNTIKPYSNDAIKLKEWMQKEYNCSVLPMNCNQMQKNEAIMVLEQIAFEFPVSRVDFYVPKWIEMLENDNPIKHCIIDYARKFMKHVSKMQDLREGKYKEIEPEAECEDVIKNVNPYRMSLVDGTISVNIEVNEKYYFKNLSDLTGVPITSEYQLISEIAKLTSMKKAYEKVQDAMDSVMQKGYGVVMPELSDITMDEPVLIQHGNKYGVKMNAISPSIHFIRANIETEIAPIVGSREQAEDLITYIKDGQNEVEGVWNTNIFGKSIGELMEDGIRNKIMQMDDECQVKLQDTMQKIVNDSKGGMVCIII